MNSLLIYTQELQEDGTVVLTGERARSVKQRFSLKEYRKEAVRLKAGLAGGGRGTIEVLDIRDDRIQGVLRLSEEALPRANAVWIVAIPRPQMIKRILFFAASLGVNEIHFIRSEHTQKSYFQSTALKEDAIQEQLLKGLEQSGDTIFPAVSIHPFFKPFLEEELPGIQHRYAMCCSVLGDTNEAAAFTSIEPPKTSTLSIAVGPERGWNAHERQSFISCGFQAVSLGERIYQVDHAISILHAGLKSIRESNTHRC